MKLQLLNMQCSQGKRSCIERDTSRGHRIPLHEIQRILTNIEKRQRWHTDRANTHTYRTHKVACIPLLCKIRWHLVSRTRPVGDRNQAPVGGKESTLLVYLHNTKWQLDKVHVCGLIPCTVNVSWSHTNKTHLDPCCRHPRLPVCVCVFVFVCVCVCLCLCVCVCVCVCVPLVPLVNLTCACNHAPFDLIAVVYLHACQWSVPLKPLSLLNKALSFDGLFTPKHHQMELFSDIYT